MGKVHAFFNLGTWHRERMQSFLNRIRVAQWSMRMRSDDVDKACERKLSLPNRNDSEGTNAKIVDTEEISMEIKIRFQSSLIYRITSFIERNIGLFQL